MFFSALRLLFLCVCLFICALWSPAGKGLTSWLSFVMLNCEFVTFPLVSWVKCDTWLYRFLIFASVLWRNCSLLTLVFILFFLRLHMGQNSTPFTFFRNILICVYTMERHWTFVWGYWHQKNNFITKLKHLNMAFYLLYKDFVTSDNAYTGNVNRTRALAVGIWCFCRNLVFFTNSYCAGCTK